MKLDQLTLQTPYLSLDKECYDYTDPTPLENPYLIAFSAEAARLIGLDEEVEKDPNLVAWLNGTYLPSGATPFAMCYAGYQFGHYVPRLGDGRAINFGMHNGFHLQTKGSGETLYSRTSDGRAVIRSSIREYLMSEAMHHLGIPTTRALGVIGSTTKVLRDQIENAAILMRLSPSWIRFGTFEYFYYFKAYDKLQTLLEYAIAESYPHLQDEEDRYFQFFSEVVDQTAQLIAKWQGIGFVHGVMNTDNMSIAGLTIDYGPFAMLDDFDFGFVCNKTDKAGRYSYGQQPNIAYWNLTKFADTLSPFIDKARLQKKLDAYGVSIYPDAYIDVMRQKLGLTLALEEDVNLITELIGTLQDAQVDYTLFFRTLSHYDVDRSALFDIAMDPVVIDTWLTLYDKRLAKEQRSTQERQRAMLQSNPKYILKNHLLERATQLAERGDFSMVKTLQTLASHPYDELPEFEKFALETPEEYKNLRLSCST